MNRTIKVNVAVITIAVVFLYVAIELIISIRKKPVTVYQVSKSDINNNIMLEGLAIRDELIVTTPKSGYTCFFIRDGEKVRKNATLCTIDSTGKIYTALEDTANFDELLTKDDYQDIRSVISLYKTSYSDATYYNAYNFENSVNNRVLELTGELLTKQADAGGVSLVTVAAPESGLVTYYTDGYEDYDAANISARDFDKSKYMKKTLKSGDASGAGDAIAKILPNETWHIYAKVTPEQIEAFQDEDSYVHFKIDNTSYDCYMPYTIIDAADGKYIDITLHKFMSNFMGERFLRLEILLADDTGLKVPMSSLVEKDIYKIPVNYFIYDGSDSTNHLEVEYVKKDGSKAEKDLTPTIYKRDEKYAYCDPNNFELTDVIKNRESGQEIAVSLMESTKLTGVYYTNRGTAEFRMVTVVKEIDEFALIKSSEMISPFDNVVLDSTQVHENQVLY